MAYTFNTPPNWPQPPEGWRPGPGWQPDPAWGPAPEGWVFWKDEQGRPVGPDGTPMDTASGSRDGDDAEALGAGAAGGSAAGGFAAGDSAGAAPGAGDPAAAAPGDGSAPGAPQGEERREDGWASTSSTRDYGQGWAGPAGAGAGSAAGTGGGGWGGAGAGGPGEPPQEPPRKKSFFTSTAGILSIIGAVLLILIVVLVIVLVGFFRSAGNPVADDDREVGPSVSASASASASPSSSASESSSSPSGSSQASSGDPDARPSGTRPDQGIEATTADPVYSFNGRGEQRVEADLDPNTLYYVEYWYQGDSNFIVWGIDDGDEESGLLANEIGTTAGSHWVDPDDFYSTEGFSVDADEEGVWELKVYDTQALGISDDQAEAQLSGSVAFGYTGAEATAKFTNRSEDSLTVYGYSKDGETLFTESIDAGSDAEVKLPASSEDDPVLVQVESIYGSSEWTLAFE
jgi:hypothetical protein